MPNPRFDALTRQNVIRAAKKLQAKDIQKWSVVVEGRECPVKQLLMEAANMVELSAPLTTPADSNPHYAKRKFERLGFPVHYYPYPSPLPRVRKKRTSEEIKSI